MTQENTSEKPLGYIRNLTDQSMVHLVYPGARLSFAFPIGHVLEMIADGKMPMKEFEEKELAGLYPPTERQSPEAIVGILHSITKLKLDKVGDLDVWFDNGEHPEGIRSFVPGSFTKELLELIEEYLGAEG
jgi:hypothetical protein